MGSSSNGKRDTSYLARCAQVTYENEQVNLQLSEAIRGLFAKPQERIKGYTEMGPEEQKAAVMKENKRLQVYYGRKIKPMPLHYSAKKAYKAIRSRN